MIGTSEESVRRDQQRVAMGSFGRISPKSRTGDSEPHWVALGMRPGGTNDGGIQAR
jgi:hypothetical protein